MRIIYPAITIHQPWASWIAQGHKTIETRKHARFAGLVGKRIAIHAGLQWDPRAFAIAWDSTSSMYLYNCPAGAVIALATVVEHRLLTAEDDAAALCPAEGLYGLVLTDVEPIGPYPARGQQGVWRWERP